MLATVLAATLHGLEGRPVRVEVDVAPGLPGFTIVGLADAALREARERVRGALRNSGFVHPPRRITVNLAPADLPKAGSALDLGIALAVLLGSEQVRASGRWAVLGELSLGGEVRPVPGLLPMVAALARRGALRVVVPADGLREAALVPGIEALPAATLLEAVEHLRAGHRGRLRRTPAARVELAPFRAGPAGGAGGRADGMGQAATAVEPALETPDLAEVRGQAEARRALEIALAGGHALLLSGPPGSGKTLLARTIPGLLPPLADDEALEATVIASVAGRPVDGLVRRRPYRAPHHTLSYAAMVGGGPRLSPGEVTLANGAITSRRVVTAGTDGRPGAISRPTPLVSGGRAAHRDADCDRLCRGDDPGRVTLWIGGSGIAREAALAVFSRESRREAMDERDRSSALPERPSARRAIGAWVTATIVVATLAWGCGTQPAPSPTPAPSASPAPTATPAPTPTPTPADADTLRIGWNPAMCGGVPCALFGYRSAAWSLEPSGSVPMIFVGSLVYSGLYRYDAHWNAVPDLAAGQCTPQGDGTVIRCRLVETTFQDGTPLTADDVAYSYRLWGRPTLSTWGVSTAPGNLKEVRVVDSRTVDFVLPSVDPTFLTTVLPALPILPQHAVEASYADFVTRTKELRSKDLTKLADALDADLNRTTPVCTPHVDAVEALLEKLGVHLYREDFSRGETGTFDACSYVGVASQFIHMAATALGATGLDAVAAAYPVLSIDWHPIGTGPYRFVSEDADAIHLEAWSGYHGGLAATRYLDFVPAKGDGSDLVDGSVDIFQGASLDAAFEATAGSRVRVATPLANAYYALTFNVRPGRLFADLALRKALQLCVDLPRDVEAATAGTGTPVYGPVMPGNWAYDPALPTPPRDTAAARKLIEGAGWQQGADKVYAKDGVRLAAQIVVRVARPERIKMADLIALQARDCGMDLASLPKSFDDIGNMLYQYPHDIPGTKTPFDLYIGGWTFGADPGLIDMFISSAISDAKHPDAANFGGFSDPVVDRLDAAELSTYDQAERASLYRQEQKELAAQLPYLFLWSDNGSDAVRSAVTTVDGPLDLTAPNWAWQPERMVVEEASP